jgi:D-tyrosyl-tRNA(Tyr) deacylase
VKAHIQRVTRAEVRVDGARVSGIERGMVVLLGVLKGDDASCALRLAERVSKLRLFEDESDRMRHAATEVGARCLVVSQITLAWDGGSGNRPSFERAAEPETARELCHRFVQALRERGVGMEEGVFGARMEVELVNSGPVTFLLEEVPASTPRSET